VGEVGRFLLTIAIAYAGGTLARRLKIPAGGMVGAMAFVIIFNLLTGWGVFYQNLRVLVQIGAGALIGARMKKANVRALKKLVVPIIIINSFMIVMNLAGGFVMYKFSDLDVATCFFASAPGGMADMAIIAADLGANPAYVAVLQLLRVLTIIICMPPIFKKLGARNGENGSAHAQKAKDDMKDAPGKLKAQRLLITVALGATGGLILRQLGVPAGAMIGSMAFVTVFNATTDKAYYPSLIRQYTQILSGAYVGMRMDKASLLALPELIVPVLVIIVGVFAFAFLTGYALHRIAKLPLCTSLMASSPGGLQEISLLADDLGLDAPTVALLQSARLMFVVALFPTMLSLILRYLL